MANKSKGCIIFAIDNDDFKYTRLADVAAGLVKKNLGLPTTIITDKKCDFKHAEGVVIIDKGSYTNRAIFDGSEYQNVKWFNQSRPDAFDLSPYDQTLLIDADYFVLEPSLRLVFATDNKFMCYSKVFDPTQRDSFSGSKMVSKFTIPMLWATVCYFDKSDEAYSVFHMMKQVRDNYDYYHKLFGVDAQPYRNDYALTIAAQTVFATTVNSLPAEMCMLSTDVKVVDYKEDRGLIYMYEKNSRKYVDYIKGHNVHILGKWELQHEHILDKIEKYEC
jgi:hypothetical protein